MLNKGLLCEGGETLFKLLPKNISCHNSLSNVLISSNIKSALKFEENDGKTNLEEKILGSAPKVARSH